MVDLCENHYYTEFFWFPNHGPEEGFWENCWNNDGLEEDSIDINETIDDEYQVTTNVFHDYVPFSTDGLKLHV